MSRLRVDGKVVEAVDLLKKRSSLWRLDVFPFIILYSVWLLVVIPSIDFVDACIVLGGLSVLHILVLLFTSWSVDFRCLVQFSKVKDIHRSDACKVIPAKFSGSKEIVRLRFRKQLTGSSATVDAEEIFFDFRKQRFIYSTEKETFCKLPYPSKETIGYYLKSTGHGSDAKVVAATEKWGKNVFEYPQPTFQKLMKEHCMEPFFVFQVFCVGLWCLDEYWYYSLFTLVMLFVFESTMAKSRLQTLSQLRSVRVDDQTLMVHRCGKWVKLSGTDLLPGDVVSVGRSSGQNGEDKCVPADMLILAGSAIVNEAILTGESTPQWKVSIVGRGIEEKLSSKRDKSHILFGGTKILQHNPDKSYPLKTPDGGCVAVVLRTGFETSQGKLMRTILFSTERVTANSWESGLFILFLVVFAVIAAGYVLKKGLEDPTRSKYKLFLSCTLIITSVIPPELPMELSIAVNTSLIALARRGIFCTEPFRIPFAGKVDICCFDKTGTLTSDDMEFQGVVGLTGSVDLESDMTKVPLRTVEILATCHALVFVDNKLVGDPLEKAALKGIDWIYTSDEKAMPKKGGNHSVQIVQRHHFASHLKRMAVVIRIGDDFFAFVKGAPETIQDRLIDLPPSYVETYKKFTRQGSRVLQRGYSRVVYCNDPDNPEAIQLNYRGNYVSTTKYTAANFIPKSLFEQFRRVANIYFLVVACVSFSPLAPYTAGSILFPLVAVIGFTMLKEAVEDWKRRKQDIKANNRKAKLYGTDHTFHETKWKNLRVGDLVKIVKDEFFPADLLLLSSSYEDGICYVETMNLDGETNLKVKQALPVTSELQDERSFQKFKALIKCEDPNENLYSFVGSLSYNGTNPLSPHQILLRDSKLRNTEYIYGVVVFTGHDTKVMQNATEPPSKRSKIERKMDKIIYILFSTLILISSSGSIFFGIETKEDISGGRYKRWYLRPDSSTIYFDPRRAQLAAVFHFLTGLMLYGYLIPISLYVSIEFVKILQSRFINQDQDMYHEETNRPARARTSNLNEELGQVDTILSDKTGTLTCNSMEFIKCSIAGTAYGRSTTEVERAVAMKKKDDPPEFGDPSSDMGKHDNDVMDSKLPVKGFNFRDERIMNGQWIKEPCSDAIQKFFRVLAICHTAIPDINKEMGEISYEAESPDEAAFVVAARELGFEFYERTQTSISLHELNPGTGKKVDRSYKLLHVVEFSSSRKRMSVVVKNEEGQFLLLCKGADSVMFERLSEDGRTFEAQTKNHIRSYAKAGLRTLVVAYRQLSKEEYETWQEEFLKAKNSVTADRDTLVDAAADKIERDFVLLGATAVEDKLQKGVPECINKLSQAGIKIWVLTGDKLETAVNIGYACSLLREEMKQIVITLDTPESSALEDKEAIAKASHENVTRQIQEGISQVISAKEKSVPSALIIDGKSLDFALTRNLDNLFLELALGCASVICCRSSPKQKALVTRLVKIGTGKTTLAIGDGANDVGMLQEAEIGVGISGAEGMQAVMSSDFAIAQFRFLERLLLVHGHWCYRRIAMMICYFFYKNITFGFTLFWFEANASFSGQPAYNDWYMSLYNVFFTSLPVIAIGVFDQDVSARLCLKYPLLHQEGVQNILFSWHRILGWMLNGICSATIIFFLTTRSIVRQAFRGDGRVADSEVLAVAMYSCVVWTVNCQMALSISYFTWIQHLFIWGSISFWYIFLVIYGSFLASTTAYKVLVEACAPSPLYWWTTLFVVISALLPYFTYKAFQISFFPMYHNLIQRSRLHNSNDRLPMGS